MNRTLTLTCLVAILSLLLVLLVKAFLQQDDRMGADVIIGLVPPQSSMNVPALRQHIEESATLGLRISADFVTLLRVDYPVEETYASPPHAIPEHAFDMLLRPRSSLQITNAAVTTFWQEAAKRASGQIVPVGILLVSDGSSLRFDSFWDQKVRTAARQLLANPRVAYIGICNVPYRDRAYWRTIFSDADTRLHLYGPDEDCIPYLGWSLNTARRQPLRARECDPRTEYRSDGNTVGSGTNKEIQEVPPVVNHGYDPYIPSPTQKQSIH